MAKQNLIEKLELIKPIQYEEYNLKNVKYGCFCWHRVRGLINDKVHFNMFNLIIEDINERNLIQDALRKLIHGTKKCFNVYHTPYTFLIEHPRMYTKDENRTSSRYVGKNKKQIRGIINPSFAGLGDPFLEFFYELGYKDKPKISYGRPSEPVSENSW